MAGGIISKKHLEAVNARLDELEAGNVALAKVILDQQQTIDEHQRLIDTLVVCLAGELGISKERGLDYRRRALEERKGMAAKRSSAVDTAHLDAKRSPVPEVSDTRVGAEGDVHVAGPVVGNAGTVVPDQGDRGEADAA